MNNIDNLQLEVSDIMLNNTQHEKILFKKIKKFRVHKTERTCVFCMDGFKSKDLIKMLPCRHYFHYSCLKMWIKIQWTCPVCKIDVKKYLEEDEEESEESL